MYLFYVRYSKSYDLLKAKVNPITNPSLKTHNK